jgi:hypothetical protein
VRITEENIAIDEELFIHRHVCCWFEGLIVKPKTLLHRNIIKLSSFAEVRLDP